MMESWSDFISLIPSFGVKIGTALLCGLLLGIERERKDKPAGVRTIVLITLGSTLYMLVSSLVGRHVMGVDLGADAVDPGRIAAQVVSGIGFIGAGTIIQSRGSIHGLTTASVIWVAAGIGLCIGLGYPLLAIATTLVVLGTLIAMEPLRRWLSVHGDEVQLEITLPNDSLTVQRLLHTAEQHAIEREGVALTPSSPGFLHAAVRHRLTGLAALRLVEAVTRIEGVHGSPVGLSDAKNE
jgi:putative Mg2+ transporter-C (MgtC) family protein